MHNISNYILEKLSLNKEAIDKMDEFDKDGVRLVEFLNNCEADMENFKLKHEIKHKGGSKLVWVRCSCSNRRFGSTALTNLRSTLKEYIEDNWSEIRNLVSTWALDPMQKGYFYIKFAIR